MASFSRKELQLRVIFLPAKNIKSPAYVYRQLKSQLQHRTIKKACLLSYFALRHGNFGGGVELCVWGASLMIAGARGQTFLSLSHADL